MSRYIYAAAVVLFALSACNGCQDPQPVSPTPPAPTVPSPGSPCDVACIHIGPGSLDCPEGRPTAGGLTCAMVCGLIEDSGIQRWHPDCVAAVRSCSDVPRCAQ